MKVVEMEELLTMRRKGRRRLGRHCSGGEGGATEARRWLRWWRPGQGPGSGKVMVAAVMVTVTVMEMVAWIQVVKVQGMWRQSDGSCDEERGGVAAVGKWLGLCNLEPMVLGNKQHGEWMVVTEKAAMAATRTRKAEELDGSMNVLPDKPQELQTQMLSWNKWMKWCSSSSMSSTMVSSRMRVQCSEATRRRCRAAGTTRRRGRRAARPRRTRLHARDASRSPRALCGTVNRPVKSLVMTGTI
jgi:hypothetical protein